MTLQTTNIHSLFTDGGARGNPGPAGAGAVIFAPDGSLLAEAKKYLGISTNNEAEYLALIMGLELAKELQLNILRCFLDSELVVKQIKGEYKVKNERLVILFSQVKLLMTKFDNIEFKHVPRKENSHADKLVNLVLDEHTNLKYA